MANSIEYKFKFGLNLYISKILRQQVSNINIRKMYGELW